MKISARYEVLGLLGQGGMGVVYHVRDTTRGRENALKTLAPGRSEDIVERFLTEAQVMFRLEHDNIVRVYDFGKDGETYFLTMELIRGKNLRQLLNARQNKGFPLADVIRMGMETADALNYAHSQKPEAVVHRDIKPVNIMIEEETGRVVVTDFGIAKLMADAGGDTSAAADLSRTVFAGTVPYSAPEQFQPVGPTRRLDGRVDIYALGIVLYEIYTGRHFFAGLSADEVELHHRAIDAGECPVKNPHACDHKVTLPDTPESFAQVIQKAIARDRNERYKTAAEMLADLQSCAAAASVHATESARHAAEAAGALEISPTDYRRGGELEREAKDAQQQGDYGKAAELFRGAQQAFGAAAAQAGVRRAQQAVQQAKAAMQVVAREATDGDTAALAPEAMRRAAQLVAVADASEAQGQLEEAAAQYGEAEEAFRAALASARLASARKELEAELPAVRAAREAAEQADAPTLAADAFAAAVREQADLEAALAAGELERVRELLPKVRADFASVAEEAERRRAQQVEEARTAMRAVAAEAAAVGAATNAKAAFIEAESLAGAAEKLVARGELDLAIAQLGRATDAYRAARAAALRAAERDVLERELPAIRAARSEAEDADAPVLAAEAFTQAAQAQSELETALAAGELSRVRTLLPTVGEGFAAAKAAAIAARASQAAVEARAQMERAREAALAAGAERYVPDALTKVRGREREATTAEERRQWPQAEQLHREIAKAYDELRAAAERRAEEQRLASALAEARTAMEAARTHATSAGAAENAADAYRDAGTIVKRAEAAPNDAAGMRVAIEGYARATERYEAATAEAERVARRNELQATLASVEAAKKQALEAGAGGNPEFVAAGDELAAAERAFAADELSLVGSSAAAARERFVAAKTAVVRAQAEAAADAALADVAAQCAEAREAGAETFAAEAWSRAVELQKQALAHRHDGDCAAVLPLATAADEAFATALDETVSSAQAKAAAAKSAAELAGGDDKANAAADKSYATAEQRRSEGKLVGAAVAFRKAAETYTAMCEARLVAARAAEAEAKTARSEAEKADAVKFAAADHRSAVGAHERAAAAMAAGRAAQAEQEFGAAARGFRAAAQIAAREKQRAAAGKAREAAEAARERATAAAAAELAAGDFKRASDAFGAGERALESEHYDGSLEKFTQARDGFERSREAAERAAREREAKEGRARAERLRTERAPAASGFFARRKLAKADAVLARGDSAATSGDFAAAQAAFTEAAELFAALPAPAAPEPPKPAPAAPTPRKAAASGQQAASRPQAGKAPAGKAAAKAPAAKPARPPAPARGGESTTVLDGATAIATATGPQAQSAPEAATVVAGQTEYDAATVLAGPATSAPSAGDVAPVSRGVPMAWIGAAAAGVVLVAGVWMLRGRTETPSPTTSTPPVASKIEPKEQPDVPPVVVKPNPPAATAAPVQVAKIEPTALPPPPVPRIASFNPTEPRVEPANDTQQFRIALADPGDATYTWSVDGRVLSDATESEVTLQAKNAPQRVAVVARTAGGEARKEWELAALPPQKPPPGPPIISNFTPSGRTVPLGAGKSTRFSVKATADGDAPLRYAWSVDGKSAGNNTAAFDFTAEEDDEGASRQIRAEVSNGTGEPARKEWTVTVPFAPPTITRQSPAASELVANVGETTDFSVDARAGRSGSGSLTYDWTINKRPASNVNGPRFTYRPEREGTADIEVRIAAPDRPAAVRRWTVRARPPIDIARPQPTSNPVAVAAVPPRIEPTPKPPVAGNAKVELENWIAAYRAAYQAKDVDRLVALGVVKPENRSKLASALGDLDDLKVTITSSSIEVQGPDSAVVSLTREDSYKAGGRVQSQDINIKKNLRKMNGAWVAQ